MWAWQPPHASFFSASHLYFQRHRAWSLTAALQKRRLLPAPGVVLAGTLFTASLLALCVYAGTNAHLRKIQYLSLSIIFSNVIFEEPFFFSWLQSVTKKISQMHCKLGRGWELDLLER